MKWYWVLLIVLTIVIIIYFIARAMRFSQCSGIFKYTESECRNPVKDVKSISYTSNIPHVYFYRSPTGMCMNNGFPQPEINCKNAGI